uniref:Probable serine/threonine-protein kinase DDB_G0268876-like n=1 Tax=Saccoglossus kowalevskii TaxID=10224 RepID=A0ABM0M1P3_SACKO|nr:PREDICTED: probable serine/threonine-protein kinase DDB_G0268876-like [Saccoglossus kowalevskii]
MATNEQTTQLRKLLCEIFTTERGNTIYETFLQEQLHLGHLECRDTCSFTQPNVETLCEFDPLLNEYKVKLLSKNGVCYLNYGCDENDALKIVFPMSNGSENSKNILHGPEELWGYDDTKQLIIAVITSCHGQPSAKYTRRRNGAITVEDSDRCCIFSALDVPKINRKDLKFEKKNEIGRRSFGVVYKGSWIGTDVAIKEVKVRNARLLQATVRREIQVYSRIRHPNIVQLMTVATEKTSIYIVSEYIDGANMEEILFREIDFNSPEIVYC